MFKIIDRPILILVIFIFLQELVVAQVTIQGPVCVVAGTSYQYTIRGNWDSLTTMQLCVTGGNIADSVNSVCTQQGGAPLGSVLVVWNTTSSGSLQVSSAKGNFTLNVSATAPLFAGSIDSANLIQVIGFDSLPAVITCSADSGGSCIPGYNDQWQQSSDRVSWTDISGATSGNLTITTPLTQSTFYRRQVTEAASGSIAYSQVVAVFVSYNPAQTDSTIHSSQDTTATGFIPFHRQRYKPHRTETDLQTFALKEIKQSKIFFCKPRNHEKEVS